MKETTNTIKQLHEQTGASYMESKKYLEKTGGDAERAAALLYEKGISLAGKRTARLTKTGIVEAYVHTGSRIGVMLELRCETDFAALKENVEVRRFVRYEAGE